MIKNKYKEDYQKTEAGRYEYIGRYYTLPMDPKEKKRSGRINLGAAAAFLLVEIGAGLINQDSSRTAWIVFPYLFLFLPVCYMGMGAFAYLDAPIRMERAAYQNSLLRLKRSCLAVMVLAGICMVLDAVYLILHFSQINLLKEGLYLGCFVLMELLGVCYGKAYDRIYAGLKIE